MEDLETKFNNNLEQWREHCKKNLYSSCIKDYIDCNAYKNIVEMGREALPLIRKAYDTEQKDNPGSVRWLLCNVVRKIVGDEFTIPTWMQGKISTMEKYTIKWLDENIR